MANKRKKPSRERVPESSSEIASYISAMSRQLAESDDLGAVIRSHTRLESMLVEYVGLFLKRPEKLADLQGFATWVVPADSLGLDSQLIPPLRRIGKIRNDFAHGMQSELTLEQVNNVYNALSPAQQEAAKQTLQKMRAGAPEVPRVYSKLEPRDQFSLIFLTLWGQLVDQVLVARVIQRRGS